MRRGVGTLASPVGGGARRSWDQDEGDASVPTPLPTSPAPCMIREEIRYTRRVRDAETRSAESVPAPKPGACDVDAIAFSLLLSKIERYLKSSTALIAHGMNLNGQGRSATLSPAPRLCW